MQEGFFAIYYTGRAGSGLGLIALSSGTIVGVDAAGGTYDGEYSCANEDAHLEGNLRLSIPAGVSLVTGITAPEPICLEIPLQLPRDFADSKIPVTIHTSTGAINVLFKKLRDLSGVHGSKQ